jgi:hypothetical protein
MDIIQMILSFVFFVLLILKLVSKCYTIISCRSKETSRISKKSQSAICIWRRWTVGAAVAPARRPQGSWIAVPCGPVPLRKIEAQGWRVLVGMLTVGEVVLESPTATMRLKMPECHVGEVSKDLDVGRRHSQRGSSSVTKRILNWCDESTSMAASGSGERALWRRMEAVVASFCIVLMKDMARCPRPWPPALNHSGDGKWGRESKRWVPLGIWGDEFCYWVE